MFIGWSVIEGLGAVLVIPAIAALVASNYEGKDRIIAFAIIGAISGAAVAAGPLVGGFLTTYLSWRYVFVGEVVIMIVILLVRKRMPAAPRPDHPPRLDVVGAVLSAGGLVLIVFGILQSSKWGWVAPIDDAHGQRSRVTPFGFSLVPFLIVGGVFFLWFFAMWEERRRRHGQDTLLERALLGIKALPGRPDDAHVAATRTDGHLLRPAGVPAGSSRARRLRDRQAAAADVGHDAPSPHSPARKLVTHHHRQDDRPDRSRRDGDRRAGHGQHDRRRAERDGIQALALRFGVGAGLMMSQLGNVIMSSAPPGKTNEAGGLQGTAQNLGASLGTALIGSVPARRPADGLHDPGHGEPGLLGVDQGADHSRHPAGDHRDRHDRPGPRSRARGRAQPLRGRRLHGRLRDAELDALKKAMFAVGLLALVSLVFTRRLPDKPTASPETQVSA